MLSMRTFVYLRPDLEMQPTADSAVYALDLFSTHTNRANKIAVDRILHILSVKKHSRYP